MKRSSGFSMNKARGDDVKKLFESDLHGHNESASKVTVYLFNGDTDEEFWELYNMSHTGLCDFFNVFDEGGYDVMPGATYHTYDYQFTGDYLIMTETVALNV